MQKVGLLGIVVLALALAVWVFFYWADMPLSPPETLVVAGVCFIAVLSVKWIWGRLPARRPARAKRRRKQMKTIHCIFLLLLARICAGAEPVVCSVDHPIVENGGAVHLKVWTSRTVLSWTATAGRIHGNPFAPVWDFSTEDSRYAPQPATASVRLRDGGECSVRLFVKGASPVARDMRGSGRSYLIRDLKEVAGYGLYSYVLFGSRPTGEDTSRFLKTIAAYSEMIDEMEDLEDLIRDRSKLNITYLPVDAPLVEGAPPDVVLQHYDFGRARQLLNRLPGEHLRGPYLVSSFTRLGSDPAAVTPYLIQNLSEVPASGKDLISWWVREFINQAAQERFWEPRRFDILTLRLRTVIAILAVGLPEVQKGLSTWIAWSRETGDFSH